jgi:hypothetical protein
MTKRSLILAAIMLALTASGMFAGYSLANNNRQPMQDGSGPEFDLAVMNKCDNCCDPCDVKACCEVNMNVEPPFDCESMLQDFMDRCCPAEPKSPGHAPNDGWTPADGQ